MVSTVSTEIKKERRKTGKCRERRKRKDKKQTDSKTDRQTDRQKGTERHLLDRDPKKDRQTDRQTETETVSQRIREFEDGIWTTRTTIRPSQINLFTLKNVSLDMWQQKSVSLLLLLLWTCNCIMYVVAVAWKIKN